jgi:hypothetical protein
MRPLAMVNFPNPPASRFLRAVRPAFKPALLAAMACAVLGLAALPRGAGGLVVTARAQGADDERQAYQKAIADPTPANLKAYLRKFPIGEKRAEIGALLVKAEDDIAWGDARKAGTRTAFSSYLLLFPQGMHADEARQKIAALPPDGNNEPQPQPPAPQPPASQPSPPQPATPTFNRFVNRDLSGSADKTVPAGTIEECEGICGSDGSCAAYTYNRWARLCFIKSSVGELATNARVTSGVKSTYGTPPASTSAVSFEHFRGRGFMTDPARQTFAPSSDGCENACSNWGGCIAYTFRSGQNRCDLYDVTEEYFPQAGSTSGAKRQD